MAVRFQRSSRNAGENQTHGFNCKVVDLDHVGRFEAEAVVKGNDGTQFLSSGRPGWQVCNIVVCPIDIGRCGAAPRKLAGRAVSCA